MDFSEQIKAAADTAHKVRFCEVLSIKSGLVIAFDDIQWASSLSRDEMFIVALVAHAKARLQELQP